MPFSDDGRIAALEGRIETVEQQIGGLSADVKRILRVVSGEVLNDDAAEAAKNGEPKGRRTNGRNGNGPAEPGLVARILATTVDARLAGALLAGAGGTGLLGGLAWWGLRAIRRRAFRRIHESIGNRRNNGSQRDEESAQETDAGSRARRLGKIPFPRKLDEARQLLAIRQAEGRVAPLDALRGMFLGDEAEKILDRGSEQARQTVQALLEAIDRRVDEVAPISSSPAA